MPLIFNGKSYVHSGSIGGAARPERATIVLAAAEVTPHESGIYMALVSNREPVLTISKLRFGATDEHNLSMIIGSGGVL